MRSIVESIYLTYIYQSSCGHVKALHALGKKKHPYMEHLGGGSAGGCISYIDCRDSHGFHHQIHHWGLLHDVLSQGYLSTDYSS